MAVKRGGLGKGLDSLIPDNGKAAENEKKVKVVEKVVEKIIVERKYTNEITPIQAILPIVMEEIERKRKKYIEEHPEEFKK